MNDRFRRVFWISAGAHVVVIVALLTVTAIRNWVSTWKPKEVTMFVSLHTPQPPAPSEPPPPIPKPPEPKKVEKKPIERSTQRVSRVVSPPQPPAPPVDVAAALSKSMPTGPATGTPTSDDWRIRYYQDVHARFHAAWEQPGVGAVPQGTKTIVRITVERNGTVTQRRITGPSGNQVMDDSIQRAMNSVQRMSPLPGEHRGATLDIDIEFELTGVP